VKTKRKPKRKLSPKKDVVCRHCGTKLAIGNGCVYCTGPRGGPAVTNETFLLAGEGDAEAEAMCDQHIRDECARIQAGRFAPPPRNRRIFAERKATLEDDHE
jgi:hypothetical protein